MILRKQCLPPGWYPRDPGAIAAFLGNSPEAGPGALAALAPHAGWYYSGAIAAGAVSSLANAGWEGTVAVLGGHLPVGMPPLFAMEDGAETPLGAMEIDGELRALFSGETGGAADRHADNTVEVLLPMVKYFFPRAKLLWVRLPADPASFEAGKILARCARTLGRDLKALGSTDLTHYGANYGFSPRGSGREALDWVKTVNDRRFIEAVLEGNPGAALARAEGEKSACSAGAALGCLGFAAESAARAADAGTAPAGELLAYGTSADRAEDGECPDSFVGYAAIRWG